MEVKLTIKNKLRTIRVGDKVFEGGSDEFKYLMDRLDGISPSNIKKFHGGQSSSFQVKGSLPKFGNKMGELLSNQIKSKLYGKFGR